jgi:hypothetical protein
VVKLDLGLFSLTHFGSSEESGEGKRASNGQAVFESELEEAVVAVQIEFRGNMGPMGIDRPLADEQFHGDLPAGFLISDKL